MAVWGQKPREVDKCLYTMYLNDLRFGDAKHVNDEKSEE